MSPVDGKPLGVTLATGALKELFATSADPNAIEARLTEGPGVSQLMRLRAVLTQLDVIDEPGRANPAAHDVARAVLGSIAQPTAFVSLLARILGTDPKSLSNLVADRLASGTYVGKDHFAQRTANVAKTERKALSKVEAEALASISKELAALGLTDAAKMGRAFAETYAKITGADVVFEEQSITALYRDHGEHILGHLKRPIRLACLPGNNVQDLSLTAQFMRSLFEELDRNGMTSETTAVANFEAAGVAGAFYNGAAAFDGVQRDAITDATIATRQPAHVDRATLFGTKAGDAAALFNDIAAGAMLIGVAPSASDIAAVKEHCARGGVAIIVHEGALDRSLDIPGVLQLQLGDNVRENATQAAHYIRAKLVDSRQQSYVSQAEYMAMSKAPSEINEIRQWAREESARYRQVRLLNAVLDKLSQAHPEAAVAKLSGWTLGLSRNLTRFTHGIDNFKDNKRWQDQAMHAIEESAPEVAALADDVAIDVMFASWFGIREFNEQPSYFDENSSALSVPPDIARLNKDAKHTFDQSKYAEVRLDLMTTKFLGAADSRPEVFLGSREEMQLYYRSRGFELDCTTHDSNGTEFHYFRSSDATKPSIMVMHGVDSESRLEQLSALMRVNGVDPRRCIVRGKLERVREINRSLLEHRLMEVVAGGSEQLQIAGVVVGNKNESIEAIAAMAGVEPSALKTTEYRAGPFRFRAVEVHTAEGGAPRLFLAFAPAYGELSEDIVTTTAGLGARNYMLAGAGGSLDENDSINATHQITRAIYGNTVLALEPPYDAGVTKLDNVELIDVTTMAARKSVNIHSSSPLKQDQGWLSETRRDSRIVGGGTSAVADVDQESACVFMGLRVAAQKAAQLGKTELFRIQSTLVQSDVVGKGALASGTVGRGYGDAIRTATKNFAAAIGITSVAMADGFAAIGDAAAITTTAKPPVTLGAGADAVAEVVPKMSTQLAGWVSSAEQFKGQKVPVRIVAERFGPDEEAFLEKLLTTMNPGDLWIVVDAADVHHHKITDSAKRYDGALAPNSARIRELAEKYGFETILMSLESEKSGIRGHADYLLSYASERGDGSKPGKLDVIERFQAPGNADEDPSYTVPRTIVLGATAPAMHRATPPPLGVTGADIERFLGIIDAVQEEMHGSEKSPKAKAEKLIADREAVLAQVAHRAAGVIAALTAQHDVLAATKELFTYCVAQAERRGRIYTGGMAKEAQSDAVNALKSDVDAAFDGGVRMFANGLTHRFPGLKSAITEHVRAAIASGAVKALPARTGEKPLAAPKFYPLDGLDAFFRVAGTDRMRKPMLWCGASRSSWPNVSARSQYDLHLFVEVMAKLLADQKDTWAMVTGGTRYGLEEIVHEVFAREGWHILATLSQNTSVAADTWEADDRIVHYCFPGINWFGVARPVAQDIVQRYGGAVVNIAGGAIAGDQIGLHLALGLDAWQMTGIAPSQQAIETLQKKLDDKAAKAGKPPAPLTDQQKRWAAGASVEMAERYPARAFDTLDVLCERFGLMAQLQAVKAKLGRTAPVRVSELEALAKQLGVDTTSIEARYPRATPPA